MDNNQVYEVESNYFVLMEQCVNWIYYEIFQPICSFSIDFVSI